MRILLDSLVAVMLAAVLAGVILHNRVADEQMVAIEKTRASLMEIRNMITIQIAMEQVELTNAGFPRTVDPTWFEAGPPKNHLLNDDRPWLEVASLAQRDRMHPHIMIADHARQLAEFWYNPYQGIIRARVPSGLTDEALLDTYNQTNGSQVRELVAGTGS